MVLLRLEQELTLEEIGAITGVGRETVKSRLRYAMDKLRAGLGAATDPELDKRMSTHDDANRLTPEERALAQRLARLGAQGEPSPALDARILAAAHAAAERRPARRAAPRRTRRAQAGALADGARLRRVARAGVRHRLAIAPGAGSARAGRLGAVQAPKEPRPNTAPPPPPSMSARVGAAPRR